MGWLLLRIGTVRISVGGTRLVHSFVVSVVAAGSTFSYSSPRIAPWGVHVRTIELEFLSKLMVYARNGASFFAVVSA